MVLSISESYAEQRKIAILGGSFDPVHSAHIELLDTVQQYFRCDYIELMPCGKHALAKEFSVSDESRLAMLELAIKPHDFLRVNRHEIDLAAVSYTASTCEVLRSVAEPDTCLFFIMGSDILSQLHRWRAWSSILDYVNLIVIERPRHSAVVTPALSDNPDNAQKFYTKPELLKRLLENESAHADVRELLLASQCDWPAFLPEYKPLPAGDAPVALPTHGQVFCARLQLWSESSTAIRQLMDQYWGLQRQSGSSEALSHLEARIVTMLDKDVWAFIKSQKLYSDAV